MTESTRAVTQSVAAFLLVAAIVGYLLLGRWNEVGKDPVLVVTPSNVPSIDSLGECIQGAPVTQMCRYQMPGGQHVIVMPGRP